MSDRAVSYLGVTLLLAFRQESWTIQMLPLFMAFGFGATWLWLSNESDDELAMRKEKK